MSDGDDMDESAADEADPTEEAVVETAAAAAEDVIFSRFDTGDLRDYDVTVSFEDDVLDVDVLALCVCDGSRVVGEDARPEDDDGRGREVRRLGRGREGADRPGAARALGSGRERPNQLVVRVGRERLLGSRWFRVSDDTLARFEGWFDRWGAVVVPVSNTLLFTRGMVTVPAGLAGMDDRRFVLLSALGTLSFESILAALYLWFGTVL